MRLKPYENLDEILSELIEVLANHYGSIPLYWGFSKNEALKSVAVSFVNDVISIAKAFDKGDISIINVNPCQIAKTAVRFSITSKLILDMDRSIVSSAFMDLFNLSVEKRIYAVEAYRSKIENISFITAEMSKSAKSVLYLNALVRAYCELIYCDEHTISGEISGPYNYDDGQVIIRDFRFLNPIEIHDMLSDFKYKRICTYCSYNTDKLTVDLFGNIPSNDVDFISTLKCYFIEVEDRNGDIQIINNYNDLLYLINYFEKWISMVAKNYELNGRFYLWKSTIACEYFAIKPFLDEINIPWNMVLENLSHNMYEKAKFALEKKRQIKVLNNSDKMDELYYKRLLDSFDPRTP